MALADLKASGSSCLSAPPSLAISFSYWSSKQHVSTQTQLYNFVQRQGVVFLFYLFFLKRLLYFYLLDFIKEQEWRGRGRDKKKKREREKGLSPAGLIPRCPQWPKISLSEAGSQDFFHVSVVPKDLRHPPLLSQTASRELVGSKQLGQELAPVWAADTTAQKIKLPYHCTGPCFFSSAF